MSIPWQTSSSSCAFFFGRFQWWSIGLEDTLSCSKPFSESYIREMSSQGISRFDLWLLPLSNDTWSSFVVEEPWPTLEASEVVFEADVRRLDFDFVDTSLYFKVLDLDEVLVTCKVSFYFTWDLEERCDFSFGLLETSLDEVDAESCFIFFKIMRRFPWEVFILWDGYQFTYKRIIKGAPSNGHVGIMTLKRYWVEKKNSKVALMLTVYHCKDALLDLQGHLD